MKGWVIFVLAFSIYFVSIFGGFIQDDVKVIQNDSDMGKASALMSAWVRPYYYMENEKSVYRPVTSFSFYLNALITGKEAWGFRLGNVLIYGWVCWLVYRVLKELKTEKVDGVRFTPSGISEPQLGVPRFAMTEKVGGVRSLGSARDDGFIEWWRDGAFWGAVIFTVLPIHTEVVNNIVGRAEMLSLGFLLLAILKSFEKKWEMTTLLLLLAMLSKETAVVGVPIVLCLIWANRGIKNEEKWGAGLFVCMALVGFLLLRTVILGGVGTENRASVVENPLKFVEMEKRVMNAIALVPFGIVKVIFPVNLSYDYSYNQIKLVDSWLDWRVLVGIAAVVASIILVTGLPRFGLPKLAMTNKGLRGQSSQALKVVGMVMFWGPILITGNLLFPIGTIFGERLWFWPSLGLVMLSFSAIRSPQKTVLPRNYLVPRIHGIPFGSYVHGPRGYFARLLHCLFIISCLIFAGRTVVRNLDWLSQERLFIHDAKYAVDSVMAQNNAAAMYMIQHNLIPAKMKMEEASAIYPKYPELLNNWGLYYLWTGKTEEAKKKFEECLVERPGNELCQGNLELIK